eukprot:CAMPEP_0185186010 /NCGR_PEP_ID=MMETSP1140-20130426/3728_1 /TAXON_ID=298111 /ORGANISM="Pavlova sp., Strain CCMP459" /LENGTH=169 /DNA_ID=CAMNT_0027752259 /DNA_START=142 /DNA_END=650 /DNA_ORIENTATION=+
MTIYALMDLDESAVIPAHLAGGAWCSAPAAAHGPRSSAHAALPPDNQRLGHPRWRPSTATRHPAATSAMTDPDGSAASARQARFSALIGTLALRARAAFRSIVSRWRRRHSHHLVHPQQPESRGSQPTIEGHGGAEEGVDDVGVAVQPLVHHEAEDAHLRGAAVVELDG